jgi:predicted transcriptional regulator
MDHTEQWAEQLTIAEERLGEVYEILTELKRELKNSGRKKDAGAIDEAAQRIGRYGQMFGELRSSWTTPED